MSMMDSKEFAERMREIEKTHKGDPEARGCEAEQVICDLLTAWGYGEGVRIFQNMERW